MLNVLISNIYELPPILALLSSTANLDRCKSLFFAFKEATNSLTTSADFAFPMIKMPPASFVTKFLTYTFSGISVDKAVNMSFVALFLSTML